MAEGEGLLSLCVDQPTPWVRIPLSPFFIKILYAGIAHLVERGPSKSKVVGSSPTTR